MVDNTEDTVMLHYYDDISDSEKGSDMENGELSDSDIDEDRTRPSLTVVVDNPVVKKKTSESPPPPK